MTQTDSLTGDLSVQPVVFRPLFWTFWRIWQTAHAIECLLQWREGTLCTGTASYGGKRPKLDSGYGIGRVSEYLGSFSLAKRHKLEDDDSDKPKQ